MSEHAENRQPRPVPPGPRVIAVTGGSGAGKSTFCRRMARKPGVVALDADGMVHRILREDVAARRSVVAEFGSGVLDGAGEIDRRRLAGEVFGDPERLHRLETILHPRVKAEMARRVANLKRRDDLAIVLAEVPLLAEAGVPEWCDFVVTIEASAEVRRRRLEAMGISAEEAQRRLARQTTDERRRAIADLVITNEGDRGELGRTVDRLWAAWSRGRELEPRKEQGR
jgi:dephospho-CoA kinase